MAEMVVEVLIVNWMDRRARKQRRRDARLPYAYARRARATCASESFPKANHEISHRDYNHHLLSLPPGTQIIKDPKSCALKQTSQRINQHRSLHRHASSTTRTQASKCSPYPCCYHYHTKKEVLTYCSTWTSVSSSR